MLVKPGNEVKLICAAELATSYILAWLQQVSQQNLNFKNMRLYRSVLHIYVGEFENHFPLVIRALGIYSR